MTLDHLKTLYDYSYWANRKLFAVVSQLSPEEFTRDVGGSYGSVRNTLVHMLSAEWGWLDRCGGTARGPKLNSADYPTAESVITAWSRVESYVREFLSKLTDEDVTRNVEFSIEAGSKHSMPIGELMHHAANHAVHHRGQVALLLRMLGYSPGNVDILFYYGEAHRNMR
jgi:uncharacterized damage-inducible protein DinB